MTREVVLVPGLWMPAAGMGILAARLARSGHSPRLFEYSGRRPLESNVERFARFARERLAGRPAHYIGHSLGGVLVHEMLTRHPELPVASALLLGAPVRGCLAGRKFATRGIGRWMMGDCEPRWRERDARWERREPLGVVAGTVPLGLGRMTLGRLPGVSDGVVRVEETAVDGMAAHVLVPEAHSMLIFSGRVGGLVERFIARGRFE